MGMLNMAKCFNLPCIIFVELVKYMSFYLLLLIINVMVVNTTAVALHSRLFKANTGGT